MCVHVGRNKVPYMFFRGGCQLVFKSDELVFFGQILWFKNLMNRLHRLLVWFRITDCQGIWQRKNVTT